MPDEVSAQNSGAESSGTAQQGGMQARLGPGSRIAGYVIEEQVGAGGMAVVFRARDEVLGRLTALKVLSPTLAADQEFRSRFLRESRAIAAVDEPHIVPVYAAGEADGVLYIATRFVAGGDLSSLLRRSGGPLEPGRAADLIVQVAAALDAAHQIGLVHRDVKPGNVLIETLPGRPEHAYLSDFGLTKAASGSTGITVTGMFLGTPDYCAPEQITGRPLDGRADQYALACVAFSLLTGSVPYHREETIATLFAHLNDPIPALTSRQSGLPAAADTVMTRALAKEPTSRYASCGEFASALRTALLGSGQAVGAPTPAGYAPPAYAPPAYAPPAYPPPAYTPPAPPPAYAPPGYGQPSSYPPPAYTPPGYPPPGYTPPATPVPGAPAAAATPAVPWGYAGAATPAPQPSLGTTPPPPGTSIPAGSGSGFSRRTGVIIGVAAVVLVGAGVGVGLALPGSSTSSKPKPNPPAALAYHSIALAAPFTAKGYTIDYASFSPDGTLLATDSFDDSSVVENYFVFNAVTHQQVAKLTLPQYSTGVNPPVISTDDTTLTAINSPSNPGSSSNTPLQILSWNIATRQRSTVLSVTSPESQFINALNTTAISGDGSTLAIEDSTKTGTDLYNLRTGVKVTELPETVTSPITGISLDNNGHELAVSHQSGVTYVWNTTTQKLLGTFQYNDKSSVKDVTPVPPQLSPDGSTLEIFPNGNFDGPDALWSVATQGDITPKSTLWPSGDYGGAFTTDGQVFVNSGNKDVGANIWAVATGKHLFSIVYPDQATDQEVLAISPNGKELATADLSKAGTAAGRVYLWTLG
jgi:serine/threonine protein kinase